nr:MAG TPA: hypothetical protein [Caudoviricetes sp.]
MEIPPISTDTVSETLENRGFPLETQGFTRSGFYTLLYPFILFYTEKRYQKRYHGVGENHARRAA